MKKAVIEITLKSDLCVGSGYSYAGVIDSDSVYDRYGLPCIPGRRLKGCLRESASEITCVLEHSVTDIFGERGGRKTGGLIVDNAHIADFESIVPQIRNESHEKIARMFSYVRAQTSMDENGVAKEDSLRFTRVVSHYFPWSSKENVFQAEVNFEDDIEEDIRMICAATRQIGMHRRRGLGQVRCELKDVTAADITIPEPLSGEDIVKIPYTLETIEPVIISNNSDSTSETCIPGRVMQGALAGRFLDSGRNADSEEFRNLFLDGQTTFSNAYLSINGERSIPVPLFVQQLKKSRKLVNIEKLKTFASDDESRYNPAHGNQQKKLTGKYCIYDGKDAFDIGEVQTKIVYHHRHEHDIEAMLYSQTVIGEGQIFSGYICTPEKYAGVIRAILGDEIRIGKSKTAQYGKCVVTIEPQDKADDTIALKKGEVIAVALDSDAVIDNDNGNTVMFEEAYRSIAYDLGISASNERENEGYYSVMETGLSFGYQTVWNLRRKPLAVIKAGSVFTYRIDNDMTIDRKFIGEKNLEGFGEISIYHMDDLGYELSEYAPQGSDMAGSEKADKTEAHNAFTTALEKEERISAAMLRIQSDDLQRLLDISPAALGRITLMLREAINDHRGDENAIYNDFMWRISSIKTGTTKDKAERFIDRAGKPENELRDCWSEVILTGLTYRKYLNAGKGVDE